jgi:hypothetical protein
MQSFIADGDILPCRFVTLVGASADGRVLAAGAGVRPYGISQKSTRRSPYIDSVGNAAQAGEPIKVYDRPGERCPLELGGTVTRGDFLKASTAGVGIVIASDQDEYGAVALESGVSGEIIAVERAIGQMSGT